MACGQLSFDRKNDLSNLKSTSNSLISRCSRQAVAPKICKAHLDLTSAHTLVAAAGSRSKYTYLLWSCLVIMSLILLCRVPPAILTKDTWTLSKHGNFISSTQVF